MKVVVMNMVVVVVVVCWCCHKRLEQGCLYQEGPSRITSSTPLTWPVFEVTVQEVIVMTVAKPSR